MISTHTAPDVLRWAMAIGFYEVLQATLRRAGAGVNREQVYARARTALAAWAAGCPDKDADIERRRTDLEGAISRIEVEIATEAAITELFGRGD